MAGLNNARKVVAVSTGDTSAANFPQCDGLWIGVGGTISFVIADPALAGNVTGTTISTTVPAGFFPVSAIRVNTTGTSATGILALY